MPSSNAAELPAPDIVPTSVSLSSIACPGLAAVDLQCASEGVGLASRPQLAVGGLRSQRCDCRRRLLAIMGSSGAGKTTLLNCLAGQLPFNKGLDFTGHISVNGIPAGDSRHSQAYIQQDDVFYSQLTVR